MGSAGPCLSVDSIVEIFNTAYQLCFFCLFVVVVFIWKFVQGMYLESKEMTVLLWAVTLAVGTVHSLCLYPD